MQQQVAERGPDEVGTPASRVGGPLLIITVVAASFFLIGGLWAFFAPRSFFESVANFPPYNRHFLHDLGSFQIGIGATLLAALRWRDGLFVALTGTAVGAGFHAASHFIDESLGGRSTDPYSLLAFALLVVAGVALRRRRTT